MNVLIHTLSWTYTLISLGLAGSRSGHIFRTTYSQMMVGTHTSKGNNWLRPWVQEQMLIGATKRAIWSRSPLLPRALRHWKDVSRWQSIHKVIKSLVNNIITRKLPQAISRQPIHCKMYVSLGSRKNIQNDREVWKFWSRLPRVVARSLWVTSVSRQAKSPLIVFLIDVKDTRLYSHLRYCLSRSQCRLSAGLHAVLTHDEIRGGTRM